MVGVTDNTVRSQKHLLENGRPAAKRLGLTSSWYVKSPAVGYVVSIRVLTTPASRRPEQTGGFESSKSNAEMSFSLIRCLRYS